jgi:hypothetical protein
MFCLDTNTLISAKNGYYGFDIVPRFWSWLEEQVLEGNVYSPRAVYNEWTKKKDELSVWVSEYADSGLSVEPSDGVQTKPGVISSHVNGNYLEHRAAHFLGGADPWVIAQAWEDGSYLVTHETAVDHKSSRVKIPNVCDRVCPSVECIELHEMIRLLGGLG